MDAIFQGRQYEVYEKSNRQLENTLKGINDYLERKRLQFPRFFFFSNEDLIFFLSREKEPASLGPFLHKCFEGVLELIMKEEEAGYKVVKGIVSDNKERLDFANEIQLNQMIDGKSVSRAVEEWLHEIETEIVEALQKQFKIAIQKKAETKTVQQIMQLVNQIEWTQCIEDSLKNKTLSKAFDISSEKINSSIAKVRDPAVSEQDKSELSNMILLNIHNKDVIDSLKADGVTTVNSYEWLSELRYYTHVDNKMLLAQCKIFSYTRNYGFDYLTDWSRLVMTPITMRCYRTLITAIRIFCGGAIEGNVGIGKTETTKDLGKALGKICFIFGGSGALQADSFARLFKGVASSGMWVCIDELNKIHVEVLSVVAQYMQVLFESLKVGAEIVDLQESTTVLNSQCGIFVTFNPRYNLEMKHEMPQSLQYLFRSMIMPTPSKIIIAQAYLESYGYKEAKELGHILNIILDLASTQLEPKKHYDFSLRSLKIILKSASKERQSNERASILNCIKKFYEPRLDPEDAIVFKHILNDNLKAQPEPKSEEEEKSPFERSIEIALKIYNLQPDPLLIEKIRQLDEILVTRPVAIVLGNHYSGKSSIIHSLATARSLLRLLNENPEAVNKIEEQLDNPENFDHLIVEETNKQHIKDVHKTIEEELSHGMVKISKICPKALQQHEIYGKFDQKEMLWYEGIVPHCIRKATSHAGSKESWLVFDGELDKSWCDGLYSALDDTRRLCLSNGETLMLPNDLVILFESDTLANATPSTISRCGVFGVSQNDLSWESIYKTWLTTLPSCYKVYEYVELFSTFEREFLGPLLTLMFDKSVTKKFICNCSPAWACRFFINTFEAFLFDDNTREELEEQYKEELQKQARREAYMKLEGKEETEMSTSNKKKQTILVVKRIIELASIYVMGIVWTIVPLVDAEARLLLLQTLRTRLVKLKHSNDPIFESLKEAEILNPPEEKTLDKIRFDRKTYSWTSYSDLIWPIEDFNQENIVIPNEELCKSIWMLKAYVNHRNNTAVLGNAGSAKSIVLAKLMERDAKTDKWLKKMFQFTGKTSAISIEELVEGSYEKRIKHIYTPKGSASTCLLCLDDMNLPNNANRQDQNPLELIRALLSHNGLYDHKQNTFKEIIKLKFVTTIALKNDNLDISQRLVSPFCIVRLADLSDDVLEAIFKVNLDHGFAKYDTGVKTCISDLLKLTLKVYKNVVTTFLPTPSKSHYKFTLKNVYDVFRGLIALPISTYENIEDDVRKQSILYKLWIHECVNSFEDVLYDLGDKYQFETILKKIAEESSIIDDWRQVYTNISTILFSNIFTGNYEEVSIEECTEKVKTSLEEYTTAKKSELNIVLCATVIKQIAKISRIISVCRRNGLLIGVGGNGRTKLTQIACFILGYNFFSLRASRRLGRTEWREHIKQLFRLLGREKNDTLFLCPEQVFECGNNNNFIDDINSLLISGTVTELFNTKEKDELMAGKKDKSYDKYLEDAKQHLHMVLCMNPISNILRKFFPIYPALLANTSSLSFLDWPDEALKHVTNKYIEDMPIFSDKELAVKTVDVLVSWHNSIKDYCQSAKKKVFTTSVIYIDMIKYFKELLTNREELIESQINKYSNGVKCLEEAAVLVLKLSRELEQMKPGLEQKNIETEKIMNEMLIQKQEAQKLKEIVEGKEITESIEKKMAEQLEQECKEQLSKALPMLEEAKMELSQIKEKDLVEMRSYSKPPTPIRIIMEMILVLLGRKIYTDEHTKGKQRVKTPNYWKSIQEMLKSTKKLRDDLEKYDKKKLPIPEDIIAQVKERLDALQAEKVPVQQSSGAILGVYEWVQAILAYDKAEKAVIPKREALKEATEKVKQTTEDWQKSQEELKAVEAKKDKLESMFREQNSEKESLKQAIADCQAKLVRAQELNDRLKGEKKSWSEKMKKLKEERENLFGNIILSAGYATYCGPFQKSCRNKLVSEMWMPLLKRLEIRFAEDYEFSKVIGDPVIIMEWHAKQLPADVASEENAIMMTESKKWPMLIDSQGQGTQFILRLYSDKVVLLKEGTDYIKKLKNVKYL